VIKIKEPKHMIPIILIFIILLTITLVYQYERLWELLLAICVVYTAITALNNNETANERIKNTHISVKILFILAVITGICEVVIGYPLITSIALLTLALFLDIVFNKK